MTQYLRQLGGAEFTRSTGTMGKRRETYLRALVTRLLGHARSSDSGKVMEDIWTVYITAFALGTVHALEVDHMVAVSVFLGNRPRIGSAVAFGLRWGLGHSVVVMVFGAVLASARLEMPAGITHGAEIAVGVMLIALGAWAARSAVRLHVHAPGDHAGHAHLHAHDPTEHPHHHDHADPRRRHRHLSTAIGAVHGLAGTATVVALVPVTMFASFWPAIGYLSAFGAGTMAAMGGYAALAAAAVGRARSLSWARSVAWLTATASAAVGVWWLIRALGPVLR